MKICVIATALPPSIDGIGDHSAKLVRELSQAHEVTILAPDGAQYDHIERVRIVPTFLPKVPSTNWSIYEQVKAQAFDWVILQYNPFAYGVRGFNLTLPRVIRSIKRDCPTTKFAIFAHERYTPVIDLKFAIMTTWQRYQYFSYVKSADLVVISTTLWADELKRKFPRKRIVSMAVGSNIPLSVGGDRNMLRKSLGISPDTIVLGVFGTAHPSRMFHYVKAAADGLKAAGKPNVVLYLGPDGHKIEALLPGVNVISRGPLPPDEISRLLPAIDVFTATVVDGVSGRRGSFFAGLQHGLATVGTSGPSTDPFLWEANHRAFVLTPSGDIGAYVAAVSAAADDARLCKQLGIEGQAFFNTHLSWEVLGRRFSSLLEEV